MNGFDRLVAIPQEEYLALSSLQNAKEPLAQHFYNLESRYQSEANIRDPYRRLVLQSNTLDEMKEVKEQLRNSLIIATPKPYQSRANALFQTIESFLRFNDKGEIYSNDGNLISGSRVEDLIQHAVRDRRRNLIPTGWSDFMTILRDHNVPKSILNRDTLDEMDGNMTSAPQIKLNKSSKGVMSIKTEPEEDIKQNSPTQNPTRKRGRRLQPPRSAKHTASNRDLLFLKEFTNA